MPTRVLFVSRPNAADALGAHLKATAERGRFAVVVDTTGAAQELARSLQAQGLGAEQVRVLDALRDPDAPTPKASPAPSALEAAMRSARAIIQRKGPRTHVVVYHVDALVKQHPLSVLEGLARYVEATRRFADVTLDYVVKDERAVGPGLLGFLDEFVDDTLRI